MGSEKPGPPIVLLDANQLYPFHLRNLLVQLGVERLIDVRWTDAIHEEWIASLVRDGRVTRERLLRTRDIMRRVLPSADVHGYEHRIAGLNLPDPGDRHVLAAAVEAGASVLLTFNHRDFPASVLTPLGVAARDPDSLLCELFDADADAEAEAFAAVVEAARPTSASARPRWRPTSTRSSDSVSRSWPGVSAPRRRAPRTSASSAQRPKAPHLAMRGNG